MKNTKLKHVWKSFSQEIDGEFSIPVDNYSLKMQVEKLTAIGTQIVLGMDLMGSSSLKDPSTTLTSIYTPISPKHAPFIVSSPNIFHKIIRFFGVGEFIQDPSGNQLLWLRYKQHNLKPQIVSVLKKSGFEHSGLYIYLNKRKKALLLSVPSLIQNKKELHAIYRLNSEILDILHKV